MDLKRQFFVKFIALKPRPKQLFNLASVFLANRWKKSVWLPYSPISVQVHVTGQCNFTCSWCSAGVPDGALDDCKDLTEDIMREILNFSVTRKAIRMGLIGGEVFLHKDIFLFIKMAGDARLLTTIYSNGSLINKFADDIYKSNLSFLGLSCYDQYYEKLLSNLGKYQGKVFNKKNRPIISMQKIMTSEKFRDAEKVICDAIQLKADMVFLQNYYPIDGNNELCIYDDNKDYLDFKKELESRYGQKISITFPGLLSRKHNPRLCRVLFQTLMIDADGRAQLCCYTPPDEKYGNIMVDPNLWNSETFMKLRKPFLDHQEPLHPFCANCYASFKDHRAV